MRVYIAGPMRGYPCYNFPMFYRAAAYQRSRGREVISPAEHDLDMYPDMPSWPQYATGSTDGTEFDMRAAISWDLQQICTCDGIVLLPGWEQSKGAQLEHALAKFLDLKIVQLTDALS